MLIMKPNCECCDSDLPAFEAGALICSFECTFCESCAEQKLHGCCPNCNGHLVPRPVRNAFLLDRFPASNERVLRSVPCPG